MRRSLAAVLALLAVVSAGAALALTRPDSAAVSKPALLTYERELVPLVQHGGRIVQQGMKAAMDDLRFKHVVPAAVIAQEADAWVRSLREVRRKVAEVDAPAGLASVETAFVAALSDYEQAATAFGSAARAPAGDERERHIADGIRIAKRADSTYDRGSAVLQRARLAVGLPTSPYFPEVSGG